MKLPPGLNDIDIRMFSATKCKVLEEKRTVYKNYFLDAL